MYEFPNRTEGYGFAAALQANVSHHKDFPERSSLREEASGLRIVLRGAVLRQRILPGGGLQTLATYHRNDVIDLESYAGSSPDPTVSLLALKGTSIGMVPDRTVRELLDTPKGARGFAALVHRELRISREHVASINRRDAEARMAHFFCETIVRACGHQSGEASAECTMPMSQALIGTVLGISEVHVNRVLQSLRSKGLADVADQTLIVYDFEALAHRADFDAGYLDPV